MHAAPYGLGPAAPQWGAKWVSIPVPGNAPRMHDVGLAHSDVDVASEQQVSAHVLLAHRPERQLDPEEIGHHEKSIDLEQRNDHAGEEPRHQQEPARQGRGEQNPH